MILENSVNATLITGTADNDSILNFGDDVTIDSRSGNDTIYSGLDDQKADRVSINAGEGDNVVSIQGGSDSVTIRTGDGNNLIGSTSPNNAVYSGAGNDSVVFYTGADNNTMETGDGDDVIDAVGHNVTIDAGAGNDRIRTYRNAYDITIKAGTGDDSITLSGPVDTDHTNVVQYADGDGNDTIADLTATDTLQITSGNISGASLVGNDVEISVGSGIITLVEANNMNINILDADGNLNQTIFSGGSSDDTVVNDTLIVGTEGNDYLINDKGKNVTINALGGNDTIDNTGDNSIIDAGTGNDVVSVAGASFVTVRTGDGDNTVYSDSNGASEVIYFGDGKNTLVASNRNSTIIGGGGGNVVTLHNGSFGSYLESGSGNDTVAVGHYDITVDAGAGNDLINLYRDAENALIKMGEGNDTVRVYNNTHEQTFQYTGGNDLINGFDANDTLRIVGHAVSNSIISDGNLILGLGDGSLTLAGVSSTESLNIEYVSKWSTLESGGWEYYSVVEKDLLGNKRPDKAAQFSLSGGNLKDENEDGIPDNVSIGSIIYVQQSGTHTNVNHLSGNVIYNGDALGVEGDDDYDIDAVSPIDTSEKFPYNFYTSDPHVTAIRNVSDGASISPRGDSGTGTVPADWYSFDDSGGTVTFMDGAYCVYTENKFSTHDYTKLTIANSNNGVEVSTADDLIQTIGNLADGYEITIESGINVGEKINFETSGNGLIVVKTTANTAKYSLDADSDEWQYQRFSIDGGNDFTFVFGENGSVVGMEDFDGMLQTSDTSLIKGEWVTLDGGKFQYTGNALNNPSKYASFVISGESITSTDNLSVKRIIYMPAQDASRIEELNGINGNATVDDVELGVSGDSLYAAHFTKINDEVLKNTIVLMDISDGATVDSNYTTGVDSNGLIKFSDGEHSVLTFDNPRSVVTSIEASNSGDGFELNVSEGIFGTIGGLNDGYAVTINPGNNIGDELTFQTDGGNGSIAIADETLMAGGENDFTVEFDDDGKVIYSKWATIDGGFVYSGHTTNNYAKTADVSLVGADLKDTNGDGAPDNVNVKVFKSNVLGVAAVMTGLSGEITLNNEPVGVIGDDNYEDHFTAKVRDGAPDSIVAFSKIRELRGISDGATVNATANDMIAFDENAKVHFGDVENVSLNNKNWNSGSAHAQIGIANNGAGADLNIEENILTEVSGLENGYSISLVSSDNVSNELAFQTDGGAGEIVIGGETLSISGENNFTLELDADGKAIMGSWSTIDGGFVYSGHATNNYAKTADVSLIGADLKDNDGDGAPDNVSVNSFTYSNVTGVMAFMSGFSGEVTLNNKDVGVSGDDDYEVHFTAKVIDNASEAVKAYAETKEVRGISTGATVNPNSNDIVGFDENAKAHMGDVTKVFLYNKNHKAGGGSAHAQIGIDNNGTGADLTIEDDILTKIGGLENGYSISLAHSDNISDELTFKTDGGNGTIIAGDTTLTVNGDKTFKITFDDDGNIAGLSNVRKSAVLVTNTGGADTTMLGGDGDDLLAAGTAINTTMTGGKGKDTFRGGVSLESALITDYTQDEDIIYHGRPFADLSINSSISGSDYVFAINGRTITVQDGADKVIKVIDSDGETRLFGKYLTLDDNDPATVTAQDGVATIDAVLRTEDIVINGNDGDNTIISSSGDCTLYGGEGNDTFVRGNRTAEQIITIADYTEGEDEVYHERPFSAFSLLSVAKSVGDDYIFGSDTAMSRYIGGADKKIKFVDVNGDVAYFGNYITILNIDANTIEATEKVKVLDATARTKAVNISGNALDNTIYGGKGNDTLTGGDGSDLFVYSAGNDVITDYTTDDKISLGAAITSTSLNGSDVVLMFGNKSLTIQNAKDQTLNLIDSSGVGNATVISVDTTQVFSDLTSDVTTQARKVDSVAANATGTKDITMSGGGAAIIGKTNAEVNITASAGRNTIISQGDNVNISLTGGNTRIFPLEGRMTLENYDASTGSGFGTTYTNIFTPVADGSIDFNNGYLNLDSAQVYMGKSSELMNFYNRDGKQQKVGYASGSDSLDASNETKNLLLVAKPDGSITGGSGNDTVFANEDSFVDGGAGKNLVVSEGATVALNGRTTVQGEVNTIYIAGADPGVDFKAEGLSFYDNNAGKYLTFDGVHSTKKLDLYYADQGVLSTHVFIADDDWYNVSDGAAQYYVGATAKMNHGIDFSGVTNDLNVTLNTDYAADTTLWINNIHSIKGGAGNTSITGSDKNDTILAGSGENSITGGAGQDKLYGNTDADKNVATFFYTPGDGRDSIANFDFMSNAQDTTADKVKFNDNSAITEVFMRGDDVGIRIDGGKEFLMLEGAQGKSFRVNDDLIAKVDTNTEFDGYTNFYVGIGSKATLTVGKGAGDVEVWLSDDSLDYHGTRYDGNFAILDASQSDGNNILAGNELSNVITGGSGSNSVWGGYGSASDTLIGGAGQNTFFYGAGNGNDNIQNAHDGDIISLEDITLDQISDANITNGGVIFKFTDGGSLTVDSTADVTYQLADGSKHFANHSTHDWDSK